MLILTRKAGQRIQIGDVVVTITQTSKAFAKIGIEAPDDVRIMRHEVANASSSNLGCTAAHAKGSNK